MATGISQCKAANGKHRLNVGVNLMTPLQGPQQTDKGQVLLVNADDWCKSERQR